MLKVCTQCRRSKTLDQFNRASDQSSGLRPNCRSCSQRHHRRYYLIRRNSEYVKRNRKKVNAIDADLNARLLAYTNRRRREVKQEIFSAYGGKCRCCGESTQEFLTIDHVRNDGAQERKIVVGLPFYRKIQRQGYPNRYQLLCYNCNIAKSRFGRCPHAK